jgi:hypothetical protein
MGVVVVVVAYAFSHELIEVVDTVALSHRFHRGEVTRIFWFAVIVVAFAANGPSATVLIVAAIPVASAHVVLAPNIAGSVTPAQIARHLSSTIRRKVRQVFR